MLIAGCIQRVTKLCSKAGIPLTGSVGYKHVDYIRVWNASASCHTARESFFQMTQAVAQM